MVLPSYMHSTCIINTLYVCLWIYAQLRVTFCELHACTCSHLHVFPMYSLLLVMYVSPQQCHRHHHKVVVVIQEILVSDSVLGPV